MGSIILKAILITWLGAGLIAAILDYVYESRKKGDVTFGLNIICDMALCLILGFFSLGAVVIWEKDHSLYYK